jgi:hypothetical protein
MGTIERAANSIIQLADAIKASGDIEQAITILLLLRTAKDHSEELVENLSKYANELKRPN